MRGDASHPGVEALSVHLISILAIRGIGYIKVNLVLLLLLFVLPDQLAYSTPRYLTFGIAMQLDKVPSSLHLHQTNY